MENSPLVIALLTVIAAACVMLVWDRMVPDGKSTNEVNPALMIVFSFSPLLLMGGMAATIVFLLVEVAKWSWQILMWLTQN